MTNTENDIRNQWLAHLSDQDHTELPSIMEDYFNDKFDFETLNAKISQLNIMSYIVFKKSVIIDDFLD